MTERLKMERGSGNVFLDIGFPPDEAQNLLLRSELMSRIERFVRSSGLTQKECAVRMGVTQPRLNDLLRANVLRDGSQLWLLDYEYAGMNDRAFDLGNLAVNNDLAAAAEEHLVGEYHGRVTARTLARMRLMKIVSDAREAMWGVVQQGISTIDFDYRSYAQEKFDRLLTNASAPEYRGLLRDAAEAPA